MTNLEVYEIVKKYIEPDLPPFTEFTVETTPYDLVDIETEKHYILYNIGLNAITYIQKKTGREVIVAKIDGEWKIV